MPEKKFSKLHFFRQKLSATSWLPLGGRLLAKQGGEGQPNNIQAFFSSKSRFILNPRSRLPLRGSCRLLPTEEVFVCLPLACKKFSKLHFFGKNCQPLRGFPLGGSSLQSKVMRGNRTTFRHFFQKAALYSTRIPGFPIRGKCLRKQTIEVDSNFFIFPRLPLGGKLLAKQGDEGQPNIIQAFFSKSRLILNPRSWLPRRGSCRLLPTEEVFACLPPFLTSSLPLA